MTPAEFATYVRLKTKTDSTTFPDADMLSMLNVRKNGLAKEINKMNEDFFGTIFTTDLVADQREYALPSDLMKIKMVEVLLDGTNWKRATEFDFNSYDKTTDESTIQDNFSDENPKYELFRKSLMIYTANAITAVTSGIKMHAIIYPGDYTDMTSTTDMSEDFSTVSPGFPREFHELLADQIVIDYKEAQDNPIPLTQSELAFERRKRESLDAVKQLNLDRVTKPTRPFNDGSSY